MSPYFWADSCIFGILWFSITFLSFMKNGWELPFTSRTFERDDKEVGILVGKVSLFRVALPDDIVFRIFMVVPAFHVLLDICGAFLVFLALPAPLWLRVLAVPIALLSTVESFRRIGAFSALVRAHMRGIRTVVSRRHLEIYYWRPVLGAVASDYGKLFMALEIVLWTQGGAGL